MDVSDKYKLKYNTGSLRLKGFDYSRNWYYFVTICSKIRWDVFGVNVGWYIILNDLGQIVENEIMKTPDLRKNVVIDEYIVMGDHAHLILIICDGDELMDNGYCRDAINRVSTNDVVNIKISNNWWITWIDNPMLNPKLLWNIIRQLKWKCTYLINKSHPNAHFSWQPNYYERIIRNEEGYLKIKKYIIENPKKQYLKLYRLMQRNEIKN